MADKQPTKVSPERERKRFTPEFKHEAVAPLDRLFMQA